MRDERRGRRRPRLPRGRCYTPFAGEDEAARRARASARGSRHLLDTDPGGAWVAERDGRVEGVALALVREGVWGLSLFARAEALQGRGVGRELLDALLGLRRRRARAHHPLLDHPQAMRRYARAGLRAAPVRRRRPGSPTARARPTSTASSRRGEAGLAVADAIGRDVRGAGHGRDLPVPMAHGARLLVFEDRALRRRARRAA